MPPQSRSDSPASYRKRETKAMKIPRTPQRRANSERIVDQRSVGSSAASHGGAAPSSVYLASNPMTRDLSDLSGSYVNGTSSRSGKGPVPGLIYDQGPGAHPWRQAYTLSKAPPQKETKVTGSSPKRDATILVDNTDVVEIVETLDVGIDLQKLQKQANNRIPVMLLLMDGGRHCYELMQIWVDRSTDSVRDLIGAIRQSIPDKWKQAYDGIFQVRGNRFTQLINILRLGKYGVQPHEILIAKPWSMSAKATISYATSAIRHLTTIGLIKSEEADKAGRKIFRPKTEESPLLLSKEAEGRIYAPDGVFTHHHACQFITFFPPFEGNRQPVDLTPERDDGNSSLGSHCTLGSDPFFAKELTDEAVGVSARKGSGSKPSRPPLPEKRPEVARSKQVAPLTTEPAELSVQVVRRDGASLEQGLRKKSLSDMVSMLRCCKQKDKLESLKFAEMVYQAELEAEEGTENASDNQLIVSKLNCCRNKDRVESGRVNAPLISLTEEQTMHWASFDIRPITEDHSTTGHSIVSMSAPLLSQGATGGISQVGGRRTSEF